MIFVGVKLIVFISTAFIFSTANWDDVTQHMLSSKDHMDKLQSDTIQRLVASDNSDTRNYAKQFDLTRSEPAKVIVK